MTKKALDLPSVDEARKASVAGAKRTAEALRKQREQQREKEKQEERRYVDKNLDKYRDEIAVSIKGAIARGDTDTTVTFHEFHGQYFKDAWLFAAVKKALEGLPEGYRHGVSSNETPADDGYPSSITVSVLIYWGEQPPKREVNAWDYW